MEILFVSDWDFTLIWKEIAKSLKKEFNYTCNSIIIGKIFHLKYKDDGFDKTWLMQDLVGEFEEGLHFGSWEMIIEEIKLYEEKYGRPTLMSAALSDRTYCNQPRIERARRIFTTYKRIEAFIDKLNPKLVIMSGYASLPQFALADICQYRKIPVQYCLHTRVYNYHFPSYNQYEESSLHSIDQSKEPDEKNVEEAVKYIKSFQKKQFAPILENLLTSRHAEHGISIGHFYRFFRYIYRYYISKTYSGDHSKKSPHIKLFTNIKNRINRKVCLNRKYHIVPSDISNCFYFPLQLQPEYSTMISGTDCIDQIGILNSLSNSLSIYEGIIVKEHPGMLGQRDAYFYKNIEQLPNIYLVHPGTSTHSLIKKTKATITINGTAGFEAALLGIPSITLSNCFYNSYKNILSLKNTPRHRWSEEIINYLQTFKYQESDLVKYIAQIINQSYSFNYIEPQENPESVLNSFNLNKVYKYITNEIYKIKCDPSYGLISIDSKSSI